MALTRITKGVIKPNENYDTHNINSTGIVTAIGLDVNGSGDISGDLNVGGILTYEDVTSIDSVGIITAQKDIHVGGGVSAVGVGTFGGLDINGDIDVDGHTNLDNVSVAGVTTFSDHVNLSDNKQIKFGASADFKIEHNTNENYIDSNSGHIYIRANVNDDEGDNIIIQAMSGEDSIKAIHDGAVELYFNNNKRFSSSNYGTDLFGQSTAAQLRFKTQEGTNRGMIGVTNANVISILDAQDHNILRGIKDGACELYHDNIKRFETSSVGVSIPQDLDVDGHTNLDNVSIAGVTTTTDHIYIDADNKKLNIGDGSDLQLYHTGARSEIINNTGDLVIQAGANSNLLLRDQTGAIHFKGAYGAQAEIYHAGNKVLFTDALGVDIDGRLDIVGTGANDHLNVGTNTGRLRIGGYADLQLFHDSTNINYISNHNDIDLHITSTYGGSPVKTQAKFIHNGAVELYHNDDLRLQTWSDAVNIYGDEGEDAILHLYADEGDNNEDKWMLRAESSASRFSIENYSTGSWVENIRITAGNMVELKHADGTTKFQTTSTGAQIDTILKLYGAAGNPGKLQLQEGGALSEIRVERSTDTSSALLFGTEISGTTATRWKIDTAGHFIPGAAATYDIGSTSAEIGNVYIADSKKIQIGNGQDFQLYWDGSDALIDTPGAGRIRVRSPETRFENWNGLEVLARFVGGATGRVELYHDNGNKRFETTATGIEVTGEVAASQDYPDLKPTLDLNFVATAKLDPRVTFNRLGCGSYYGRDGLVKFGTTNEPRFDHDPVTRECKGLLIEEQRQNMFPYTTTPGDSGWTSSKSGTFTQNTTETAAPDGTFTATKWTFTNTDPYLYDSQNLDANHSYTLSMWVKAGTNMAGDRVQMRIGGAPYSSGDIEVIPADGTWRRISYTRTIGGSNLSGQNIGFEPQTSPSGNPASGDVIYIWGPQFEDGEFLSSYIPSNSSHRPIRGADKCYIDGQDFDDFYNQPEGTIVSSHSLLENVSTTSNCYTYQVAPDSGTSEAPFRLIDRNSSYGNTLVATSINSNSSVCFFKASGDPGTVANVKMKVAFAIKKDDFAASFNGGATLTDTSGNVSETNDHLAIGYYKPSPQAYLNGHIQRLAYYPKRLPNNQLRNLSS